MNFKISNFKSALMCMLAAALLIIPATSNSAVPSTINHQGYLQDGTGPVTGPVTIVFSLYTAASGGSALWSETRSVTANAGIYNVILGEINPLNIAFDAQYYLGIKVEADSEMTPRQPLSSVGYAISADEADYAYTIADNSVTTLKISNGAVTDAKISGPISSSKISSSGLNADTLDSMDSTQFLDKTTYDADNNTKTDNSDTLDGMDSLDFAPVSHNHDSAYYTKAEVNSLLLSRDTAIANLLSQVTTLQNLLQNFSKSGNDITIAGANLHIVNGTGTTGGTPDGLGNLIVGYNEVRGSGNVRTGSHNIVVGARNNFSAFGSLIAGYNNTASGNYTTLGGSTNTASGTYSVVVAGSNNVASGTSSVVVGGGGTLGDGNKAFADYSAVLGGRSNTAGDNSLINHTIGLNSTISGGQVNNTSGNYSSISSGYWNATSGLYSSVSGGYRNTASGESSSVSGGDFNTASGTYSSITAGDLNTADGYAASISGGSANQATGPSSSIAGGVYNVTNGTNAVVSGGESNTASGDYSTVSGGYTRSVSGIDDWRGGGYFNEW